MHRLWLIVPVLQLLVAAPVGGADPFGVRIAEIAFDPPPAAAIRPSAEQALAVRVGERLDRVRLRTTIQSLFRTGRYSDIQADTEPAPDGVRLTFLTKPAWFVGNVRVEGVAEPPSEGRLVNATKLRLGELFTDDKLAEAIRSLHAQLADHGFFEPRIEPVLDRDSDTQQVHVTMRVASGRRARIGALLVGGSGGPLEEREIRAVAGWPRGAAFRSERLQKGIGRLRRHLQKRNYWRPEIRVEAAEYDRTRNALTLVVTVTAGPRMLVRVEGAGIPSGRLQRYLPILARGTVDDDLLAAGSDNLRNLFQSKGFLRAAVEYEVERNTEEEISIAYRVVRGRRRSLQAVAIEGNRAFDSAAIRERMQLGASSVGVQRDQFTQALLDEDLRSIRELYSSNGFRSASVTGNLVDNGDGGAVLRVAIEEGLQTLVGRLLTEGLDSFPADEAAFEFASAPGRPFSESNVAADERRILNEYYNAGYRDVEFDWLAEPGPGDGTMTVSYEVSHGDPVRLGRAILSGSRRTRDEIVRRRIELVPGTALSQASMFNTQRNLYDLGIFSKVDVALQNPDGVESTKDVLIQVEEARRWAFGFGGGAEFARIGRNTAELTNPAGDATFSPRVTLEVSRLNVRGKAHTMSFRSRLSLLQQTGLFTYEAPRWFASDRWRMTLTGLYDTFRNVNTFTGRRFEGAVGLSQQLNRSTTVLYRYAYRRTSIDENTLHIEPLLVPLISQPVRVGLVSSTWISDRRDDPTDTTAGVYNTVDIALASKILGSQPNFARLLAQNSTYHRLRPRVVFARTVQLGLSVPWAGGGTDSPSGFRPDPRIPLSERYFGGGANSHRGFAYNQAGPRDPATGFPLGGGSQFLNSLELRFPLAGRDLSGVLFHDAGNVYSRPSRMSFRASQPIHSTESGAKEFDFDYMVHAVGLGVRYRTPIGPVRFDLAYSPNPPHFVGFDGTRQQLLRGTGMFREQRISAVQFHFSLGQTF